MSSDYAAWVRQMHQKRDADQADQERRQLALRAQSERDQAVGVAMRQREHEALSAQAQRDQADTRYLAQETERQRLFVRRMKRMREARRTQEFRSNQSAILAAREGTNNQRRAQYLHEHDAGVRRNAARSPMIAWFPVITGRGGSTGLAAPQVWASSGSLV